MPISSVPLPGDEEPLDSSSQVAWLRSLGDREALFQVMDGDRRSIQGLEAAEALAQMGDVRGLDHLIATLDNPASGLRTEAAQMLEQLQHPRGMRALRGQQTETQSSRPAVEREAVYEDLNTATTDELVAIWHENDRAEWTDMEFEVLEGILTERLGKLPRRGEDQEEEQEIDDQVEPKIQELWMQGDVDGLRRIMEGDPDVPTRLEAAEALADLGDEDGLDLLIEMLEDRDEEHDQMAAEMLDWLDLPRGNAALREGGYAFETSGGKIAEVQEVRPPRAESPTAAPARKAIEPGPAQSTALQSWAARAPALAGESATGERTGQGPSLGASFAVISVGALGGLLGFVFVGVGLDLLGLRPLPSSLTEWLGASMVYGLIESLVVGGVLGNIGRRAAHAMAARAGEDVDEQDARLVLGAFASGAAGAAVVSVLRFVFGG